MSEVLEMHINPEKEAESIRIEWGLNPDRITRLPHNLKILFQEKNGTVYGAVEKGSQTLKLGDESLVKGRAAESYLGVQVRKKDAFSKLPIRNVEDLVTIFADEGWGATINDIMNGDFNNQQIEEFQKILSKRIIDFILATIEF